MFGSLARVPPSGPNGQFRKAIGGNKRGGAGGRVGGPAGRQEAGGSEQACNLHPSSSSPGIWAFLIRLLFCKERGREREGRHYFCGGGGQCVLGAVQTRLLLFRSKMVTATR